MIMITSRRKKYSCLQQQSIWIGLLLISLIFCLAQSKHYHGLSYKEFSDMLGSEVDIEIKHINQDDVENWWNDIIELQWGNMHEYELQDSQHRRYLRNDESLAIATPFIICNDKPVENGINRIEEIKDATKTSDLSILLNNDKRTCVSLELNPRKAEELENDDYNDFNIIPYAGGMKIRKGVMECFANGETDHSCERSDSIIELDVEMFGDSKGLDELVQDITIRIQDNVKLENNNDENNFNRNLLEKQFDLVHRRDSTMDSRSSMWRRALDSECNFSSVMVDSADNSSVIVFGLPIDQLGEHCAIYFLIALSVEKKIQSISLKLPIELFNTEAQWIVQSGKKDVRPWFDTGLKGENQVVSVSDTGLDMNNCYFWDKTGQVSADKKGTVDLDRRKVVQYFSFQDDSDQELGHGTHVTGTIAGRKAKDGKKELDGYADGIAKSAKIAFFDIGDSNGRLLLPNKLSDMFKRGVDAGAMIHSSSWGRRSDYSTLAKQYDSFMYENDDFLAITAAGNMGGDQPSIIEPGNAKNVLTVGACHSDGRDLYWYDKGFDYVAYFSSHGPVDNKKRIKPDILAPGRTILSAGARPEQEGECDDSTEPMVGEDINSSVGLAFKQGTSMATPVVSGTAALVRQYFVDGFYPSGRAALEDSFIPSGALIKAVILNGGVEVNGVDNVASISPSSSFDGAQGFGRVSLIDSLPLNGHNGIKARLFDRDQISLYESHKIEIPIKKSYNCQSNILSATLVWMDPPAAIGCKSCVLNDLDLYVKNIHSGDNYYANGRNSKDANNNVERVRVNADDGDLFEISVHASNLITSNQMYSLVVTGCINDGTDSSPTPSPVNIPIHPPVGDGNSVLVTNTDTNIKSPGVMFDIYAPEGDIVVEAFDIFVDSQSDLVISIYSKQGSYVGFETKSKRWNSVGEINVIGAGENKETHIPRGSFNYVSINRGEVHAFYITITNSKNPLIQSKQVDNELSNVASDTYITIKGGTAVKQLFRKRLALHAFSGAVYYTIDHNLEDDDFTENVDNSLFLETIIDSRGKTGAVGQMFDVDASIDISITSLGLHISSTSESDIQIYSRLGSFRGHEHDKSKWVKILDTTARCEGVSSITEINGFSPLLVHAKRTRSFYVVSTSKDLVYSKIKNADVLSSNDDMTIKVGSLTKKLFDKVQDKIGWNGVVYYELQH